jgi:putative spermidine/putrescine transport system permease protein
MRARWGLLLLPSVLVTGLLLFASQGVFLRMSLYRDGSFGRVQPDLTLDNYLKVLQDPFYLRSLGLTFEVALIVVACSLIVGFPVAYILARMRSRWSGVLLGIIVASALVAEVIKVLGLVVIFSADGVVNRALTALGLIAEPLQIVGTVPGVVVGLLHFTLGFVILLLFGVIQSIPRALEEAARIHGATPLRGFLRVVLPLCVPGLITGGLIVFNLAMGSFTAAALLGGGRVLTLPVLIERTMMLETRYAVAACLAAVLLAAVLAVNVAALAVGGRLRVSRQAALT